MLALRTSELGRRTTWICLSCSATKGLSPSTAVASQRSLARIHERRHSSSKTSSSSKQGSEGLTTHTDSASKNVPQEDNPVSVPQELQEKGTRSRPGRRKAREREQNALEKPNQPAEMNLPSVPSTQNLRLQNLRLASFFSTHRPLSITNAIPPETSASAFSSIFEAKQPLKRDPSDVIYTIAATVDNIEDASHHQQEQSQQSDHFKVEELDLFAAVAQTSQAGNAADSPKNDLPARTFHVNLQNLAKNLRPYNPPPPPVPIAALQEAAAIKNGHPSKSGKSRQRLAQRKAYQSTLTIYQTVSPDGKLDFETHSTPLVFVSSSNPSRKPQFNHPTASEVSQYESIEQESEDPTLRLPSSSRQPFLHRMYARRLRYEDRLIERFQNISIRNGRQRPEEEVGGGDAVVLDGEGRDGEGRESEQAMTWQLISVKRQRKLKMKKHKYKKLLKRTKNLRRRLDRM